MSAKVRWRYRAIHEAQDAYDWYEAKTHGLGKASCLSWMHMWIPSFSDQLAIAHGADPTRRSTWRGSPTWSFSAW